MINFGEGSGYGFNIGTTMFGYQNPAVAGFSIFASTVGNKFRLEIDPFNSLHCHYGQSKNARKSHRGAWIGCLIRGLYVGFDGEVY